MPVVNDSSPPSTPRGLDKEIVEITAATTITANHRGRLLRVNSGSSVTLTLPNNLPAGFHFEWERAGAGALIFAAASGATLSGYSSLDRAAGQYARGQCEVTSQSAIHGLAAVWNLSGQVTNATGGEALTGAVNITGGDTNITTTSASTDGGTSVEPLLVSTTMTGAGGVGGRARFFLTTNVALGSWSNALKGEVTYGAAGKTTGLGSAILAEMTLSAGTDAGTYAPIEIELNLGTGALTGTATSLIYMSVNGADAATFDANGTAFSLQGLTAGDGDCFQTGNTLANPVATLKINVGGTLYYLPLYDGQITTV